MQEVIQIMEHQEQLLLEEVVVQVELLLQVKMADLVDPVSSSSLILHKTPSNSNK